MSLPAGEEKAQPPPLRYNINSLDPEKSKPKPGNLRISYRECLKNHAANIGGDFMPSGDEGIEALRCAACSCHRNFHRREHHGESAAAATTAMVHQSPSMSQHRVWSSIVQPVKLAFGSGGSESSSEELNFNAFHSPSHLVAKKRFRTKFTTEQKEKMLEFAEKLGWRIPREDDTELQRFCAENGVKRQVFKVWMHNNKTSSKKNPQQL